MKVWVSDTEHRAIHPMPAVARKAKRPKKTSAVHRQGCCGIFACLLAAGIKVKTAKEIEHWRQLCKQNHLVRKHTGNWLGGTHDNERLALLGYLGLQSESVAYKAKTLKKLLREKDIYQTQVRFIVTVTGHCLFLQTNMRKSKLFCMDQRGTRMKLDSDDLSKELSKRVMSVWRVV